MEIFAVNDIDAQRAMGLACATTRDVCYRAWDDVSRKGANRLAPTARKMNRKCDDVTQPMTRKIKKGRGSGWIVLARKQMNWMVKTEVRLHHF